MGEHVCLWGLADVADNGLEEGVAEEAVLAGLGAVAIRTQGLKPRVLVANTALLYMVYLEIFQQTLAALTRPALAHGHRFLFGWRQRAFCGRKVVVEIRHLLGHPCVEKNTAAGGVHVHGCAHAGDGHAR